MNSSGKGETYTNAWLTLRTSSLQERSVISKSPITSRIAVSELYRVRVYGSMYIRTFEAPWIGKTLECDAIQVRARPDGQLLQLTRPYGCHDQGKNNNCLSNAVSRTHTKKKMKEGCRKQRRRLKQPTSSERRALRKKEVRNALLQRCA